MDMDCQKIQDNLSAYLDGELPAEDARQVERHVEECAVCRDLLRELRSVADVLGELPHESAPAGLTEELQSQVERRLLLARGSEDRELVSGADRALARERPPAWPRVAAVAACLLLAVGVAVLLHDRLDRASPPQGPGAPAVASADKATAGDKLSGTRIAAVEKEPGSWGDSALSRTDSIGQVTRNQPAKTMDGALQSSITDGTDVPQVMDRLTRVSEWSYGGSEGESGKASDPQTTVNFYTRSVQAKRQTAADDLAEKSNAPALVSADTANTLVLEVDEDDPAVAEAALKKVLADNGLILADAEPSGRRKVLEASTPRSATSPAKATQAEDADSSQVQMGNLKDANKETDKIGLRVPTAGGGEQPATVLVYAGAVSTEKASQLAYDIAGRSSFRVSAASRGLFVNTAEIQQLRLAQDRVKPMLLTDKAESLNRAVAKAAPAADAFRGVPANAAAAGGEDRRSIGGVARADAKEVRGEVAATGQAASQGQKETADEGRADAERRNDSAMKVATNELTTGAGVAPRTALPTPPAPANQPAIEQYSHPAKTATAVPAAEAQTPAEGAVTRAMTEAMKSEEAEVNTKQKLRESEKAGQAVFADDAVAPKGPRDHGSAPADAPAAMPASPPGVSVEVARKQADSSPGATYEALPDVTNGTHLTPLRGLEKAETKKAKDAKSHSRDGTWAAATAAPPAAQPANATYIVVQLVVRPTAATAMRQAADEVDARSRASMEAGKAAAEKIQTAPAQE